jgi:hypothetical protein
VTLDTAMELDSEGEEHLQFPPPPSTSPLFGRIKELSDTCLVEQPQHKLNLNFTLKSAPLLAKLEDA